MWNSALRKKFIVFIFQQFLASVDKFLFSGGGGGGGGVWALGYISMRF